MFLFSQDCESAVEGEACSTFRATAVIATGAGGLAGWLAGGMIKPHRWAPVALTPYSVGRVAQAP